MGKNPRWQDASSVQQSTKDLEIAEIIAEELKSLETLAQPTQLVESSCPA